MFLRDQNRTMQDGNAPCPNQILHTIRAGDTVYNLAVRHRTTVERILELNPGIDVYNLRIGSTLVICPGATPVPPIGTVPPVTPVPPIGTIPPVTPVPPIGIVPPPPVTPVPPIGTLPTVDAIMQLILHILRWIRQHFGEDDMRRMMEEMNNEIWKR